MHRRIPPLVALLALGAFSGFQLLFSTGIVGVTKKPNHVFAEPGCFCHGDSASARLRVWIEGPDSLGAGQQAIYRLFVAKDSSRAAGFNVASLVGSLGIVESSATQLLAPTPTDSMELTHLAPREAEGSDTISWAFLYTAPPLAGITDTLFANGNSVDLSGDPSGDEWSFAPNFSVATILPSSAAPPGVAASFRLLQNYPNPFNPSTTITFELGSAARVVLSVYDAAGRRVATLVDGRREAGRHTAAFPGTGASASLSTGIYLASLTVSGEDGRSAPFSAVLKMLLVK